MFRILLLSIILLAVAGCGSIGGGTKKSTADPFFGNYKIGNPYRIKGRTYTPEVDYNYQETGIASWYGKQFHGRTTANGAIFDMNKLSAAHRTLPLPSYVLVENLENGRQLKLLVNDRGPFYNDRIIDLSRAAAKRLGTLKQGTARVRVTLLADESLALANRLQTGSRKKVSLDVLEGKTVASAPTGSLQVSSLPPPQGAESQTAEETPWVTNSTANAAEPNLTESTEAVRLAEQIKQGNKLFIQVGAYGVQANALNAEKKLNDIGNVALWPTDGTPLLYRVRLGPFTHVQKALNTLNQAKARGFTDAQIIVSENKTN